LWFSQLSNTSTDGRGESGKPFAIAALLLLVGW